MKSKRARRPAIAVIGAGGLARAFLPGLLSAGHPVVAVAARSRASAARLARSAHASLATTRPADAARAADLVLLAVPDRAIEPVAIALARALGAGARGKIVLHHAGALGVAPLAPLARLGAATGVLHPLQVLGLPRIAARLLPGSWARIEGDVRARAAARRLARDLGLRVLSLPARPAPGDRAAYHAAASLVANDLVALLAIAARLLAEIGIPEKTAARALARLAQGALAQVEAGGLAAALTGPVARGDAATLKAQLRRIARSSRAGAAAHRWLSQELVRLARAAGRLRPADARALVAALADGSSGLAHPRVAGYSRHSSSGRKGPTA